MTFTDLEAIYERLAEAIDAAGEEKRDVFLAKLVLMLAQQLGDHSKVMAAIQACQKDL